jgi:hypothetical protein
MFCFSFCFTSRQVRNGDDPDAQTSKHKFQTEKKLGINYIMVVCFIGGGSGVPRETHRKSRYGKNTTSGCTIRKNNVWSRVIKLKIYFVLKVALNTIKQTNKRFVYCIFVLF